MVTPNGSIKTQTVDEFQRHAAETLERLRTSGRPEMLTHGDDSKAILLSLDEYEKYLRAKIDEAIRRDIEISDAELRAGKAQPASEAFAWIREELQKRTDERGPDS